MSIQNNIQNHSNQLMSTNNNLNHTSNKQQNHIFKIYNNTHDNPQKYSPKKSKIKIHHPVKIQIINQNLQEAILDAKNSIKTNKSWRQNIHQISNKYYNPESLKHNQPVNKNQNVLNKHFQPILCTDFYKKKFQQRLKQIKEKRMHLQLKSIQKQMTAKLNQKIKQNLKNKEKMQLLKDINDQKRQIQQQKYQIQDKKKKQMEFLHQCNEDKFSMLKKSKKRMSIRQLKDSRILEQQSWKSMKFKTYMGQRQNLQRHKLMQTKHQFLIRSQSHQNIRPKTNRSPRNDYITQKTSQREIATSRKVRENNRTDDRQKSQQSLKIQQN